MKVIFLPSFKKSWDKLFHWKYFPYRAWQWFLRLPKETKWKWQRMNRGWADSDTWATDYYIGRVFSEMLEHLARHHCGHPGIMTDKEWTAKLKELSKDIRAYADMSEMPEGWSMKKEKEALITTQKALKELAKIWGHLWD